MPVTNPSLLQQHQYSYPSLINGTTSTNILASPTFNTFPNNTNTTLSSTNFPYSSQSSFSSITPVHNSQVSSNIVQLNSSPIKSLSNNHNDVTVHYLGGYVIRESDHPFTSNENFNQKENNEQIQCIICQKIDFSQRFFDQENKFCSNLCSFKSNEIKTPIIPEPIEEQISLPPDHGLPTDPSKWTVRIKFFLFIEKFLYIYISLGFSSRRIYFTVNK